MSDVPTYALIWGDRHIDPVVYIGTERECQEACCRLMVDYLRGKPNRPDHADGRARATAIEEGMMIDLATATEFAMDVDFLYTYDLHIDIVLVDQAATANEAPHH